MPHTLMYAMSSSCTIPTCPSLSCVFLWWWLQHIKTQQYVSLSLHFDSHFSRWTWVRWYQNVSWSPFWILLEPMITDVVVTTGATRRIKAPVKLSPPASQHPAFTGRMPFLLPNQQCHTVLKDKLSSMSTKAILLQVFCNCTIKHIKLYPWSCNC